ncbi:hypothetical protein NMY22_g5052 [Coprinellus aureogranulatus]|nr:hypothetical protein NMY22_g5052 [Coprinellus aureogranulatus]
MSAIALNDSQSVFGCQSSTSPAIAELGETSAEPLTAAVHTGQGQPQNLPWHRGFSYRILRASLKLSALLFLALVAVCRLIDFFDYRSLPPDCRLRGMEVYTYTPHCRPPSTPRIFDRVQPGMLLLDGPQPKPIYWADLRGLYDPQASMVEHIANVSIQGRHTLLEKLYVDINNRGGSAIYQAQTDLQWADYAKGRALRDRMWAGAGLGRQLMKLEGEASSAVKLLIVWNKEAPARIEETMEKQPETLLAQLVARMLSRPRGFIWSWKTDMSDCVDQMARDTRATWNRIGSALTALRGISQDMEHLRHRIAEPAPPIPLYVHLKDVYTGGRDLEWLLKGMQT